MENQITQMLARLEQDETFLDSEEARKNFIFSFILMLNEI